MATIICESFRRHFGSKWSGQPRSLISLLPSFFLWEGRELPPFFNGREGMTSFFENPKLSSVLKTMGRFSKSRIAPFNAILLLLIIIITIRSNRQVEWFMLSLFGLYQWRRNGYSSSWCYPPIGSVLGLVLVFSDSVKRQTWSAVSISVRQHQQSHEQILPEIH